MPCEHKNQGRAWQMKPRFINSVLRAFMLDRLVLLILV